jgi:excisionase family DNA binding protein
MEPEISIGPVTVGPETRVVVVTPTFHFFQLPAPARAPEPDSKTPEHLATLTERKPVCVEYLTTEEAAAYIKVHVKTLQKWVRLGVFPHVPLPGAGKDYRFSRTLIDEWARDRALGKAG